VEPVDLGNGRVRLHVDTNIPGKIEVMVSLGLHGQNPDDVWIGMDERISVEHGYGSTIFDTKDLPRGKYDAEVSFYPRWSFQDDLSRATGISEHLGANSSISISGTGESASAVQERENGQRWVMENVNPGDAWILDKWVQRFGDFREIGVTRGNPKILKAYYFASIDMTVIVNQLRREVSTWRMGVASG